MTRVLAALAFLAVGCGQSFSSDDPILVVMCVDADPEEPHRPCCTAFALEGQVVTASHCVPGDTAELVTGQQWATTSNASEVGTVTARHESRDIAWLSAKLDGPGLTRGWSVKQGDPVQALTRSGAKAGIVGERAGSFWLSDMDTRFGDSGSAIVDASGAVVGVLSRCLTEDGKQCDSHSAIFAELP